MQLEAEGIKEQQEFVDNWIQSQLKGGSSPHKEESPSQEEAPVQVRLTCALWEDPYFMRAAGEITRDSFVIIELLTHDRTILGLSPGHDRLS